MIIYRPWRWQPFLFAGPYMVDQVLQIAMCVMFCQRIFVERKGSLLQSTELCHWHYAWGLSRAVFHIIASGTVVTASARWPHCQLLFFLVRTSHWNASARVCELRTNGIFQVLTNVILFSPTPRAFIRYARARRCVSSTNRTQRARPRIQHHPTAFTGVVRTRERGSVEHLVSVSELMQQRQQSFASAVPWSEVREIDGYLFHVSRRTGRHYFALDTDDDIWSLQAIRRRIPWAGTYPRGKCTTEEFLLLAPGYSENHPYLRGTPSLYDVFRDIHQKELQYTLTNYPAHRVGCQKCPTGTCRELWCMMFSLLLDTVNSHLMLRYSIVDAITRSHIHDTENRLLLVRVEPTITSTVRLHFVGHNDRALIETPWQDLYTINTRGLCMGVSPDVASMIPGWTEVGSLR